MSKYDDMRVEVGELAYEMGQFLNAIRPRLVGDEIGRSYILHNRMNKWAIEPDNRHAYIVRNVGVTREEVCKLWPKPEAK